MNIRSYKINKESMLILFLVIPFFRPDFISSIYGGSLIDNISLAWRIVAFLIIGLKYASNKGMHFDIKVILVFVYELFLLISCIRNGVPINSRLVDLGNFIGVFLLFNYYAKKAPELFIKMGFEWLSFLTTLNLGLTLFFPNGINNAASDSARINFLGKDNMITLWFLLTVVFCVLYARIFTKFKKPLFIFSEILLTELYYFSGSGIVAITVLFLYMIFLWKNKIANRVINPITVVITFVALELLIVIIGNIYSFSFLFELLGKSSTFSDRIYYWSTAISQIKESPIIGLGNGTVQLWSDSYYSHNAVLDVLMKGGIIGLILWATLIIVPFFSLNHLQNERMKGLISVIMLSAFLVGLMEGLEDRIAFNALIAVISVLKVYEKNMLVKDRSSEGRKNNIKYSKKEKDNGKYNCTCIQCE